MERTKPGETERAKRRAPRTQARTETDNAWAQAVSGGKYQTLRTLMTVIHRGEITLAETQPTLREPDTRHAPDGGQSSGNHDGL